MGISIFGARHFLQTVIDFNIRGSILTLGRQHTFVTVAQLFDLLCEKQRATVSDQEIRFMNESHFLRYTEAVESEAKKKRYRFSPDYISDDSFFSAVGFERLESVDASDFEDATIVHDLNELGLSRAAGSKFDLVFDGGTMEHVFHVPNILANIFDALQVGGYVYHSSPCNNHVDHGFYQFSPGFFHDWYSTNNWVIHRADFFRYTRDHDTEPWQFFPYSPGALDSVSFGGLDDAMYGIAFCAQKTSESTCAKIPQQGHYYRLWNKSGALQEQPNFLIWSRAARRLSWNGVARRLRRGVRRFRRLLERVG